MTLTLLVASVSLKVLSRFLSFHHDRTARMMGWYLSHLGQMRAFVPGLVTLSGTKRHARLMPYQIKHVLHITSLGTPGHRFNTTLPDR